MKRRFAICLLIGLNLAAFFGAMPLLRGAYWTSDAAFTPALENAGSGGGIIPTAYPNGKVLINTSWNLINGQIVPFALLRLNSDGTIDPTFNAPNCNALFVYPDGRVLVGVGQPDNISVLIQRLLADGSVDPAFTAQLLDIPAYSAKLVLLNDGRILLFGPFSTVGGISRRGLALLSVDGVLDTGFQSPLTAGNAVVYYAKPALDGLHIIIAGDQFGFGIGSGSLARLTLNGAVDTTFIAANAGISLANGSIYPDASGRVLLLDGSGTFIRLTSTGALDQTFTPAIPSAGLILGPQQADGKMYYSYYSGQQTLGRMKPDGTVDSSFSPLPIFYAGTYDVIPPVLCADGSLFLGSVTGDRFAARLDLTHVLVNGSIDPAFNPRFGRYGVVRTFAQQTDGKYVVAGSFDHVDNVSLSQADTLIRLNANGSLDLSFNPAAAYSVGITSLFQQSSGKIIACGSFPNGSGGFNSVIRLNPDGSIDLTFTEIQPGLSKVSLDSVGFIYAYTNEATPRFLRYTPDGVLDSSFQAIFTGLIQYIAPLADGAVLIATPNGTFSQALHRLRHDGTPDSNFQGPPISRLSAMAALPNGAALICETQDQYPSNYYSLSRVRADGSVDYNYVTPVAGQIDGEDIRLDMAGAVFDLLRAASPTASATVMADFLQSPQQMALSCRTDGQLTMQSTLQFDIPFRRYQRTALTSPSMDASPHIISLYPPSATSINLNAPFLSTFVTVSGLGPMSYQWLKDSVPVSGATTASLFIYPAQVSDSGAYSVQVSNAQGSVTSQTVNITVGVPVSILTQPVNQSVGAGATATFAVAVAGTPTPSYQWQRLPAGSGTWANLSDVGGYAGTQTATLTLSKTTLAMNGDQFRCVITNAFGSLASNPDLLTVTGAVINDFNSDGKSDIIWQNSTSGDRGFWLMNGTAYGSWVDLGVVSTDWHIVATADFNGDGKPDFLWENTVTGDRGFWLMNDTAFGSWIDFGVVSTDWHIAGAGDFDGDGKPDIVWENTVTGDRGIWLMNGTTFHGWVDLGYVSTDWKIAGVGDFNGDGKPDIVWENTATGDRGFWLMNGTTYSSWVDLGYVSTDWRIVSVGDFNGDGKTDFLWENTGSGLRYLWLLNGTAFGSDLALGVVSTDWRIAE